MTDQSRTPRPIRAVYFDVGETLINEATEYGTWADWLGVPRHTFSSVFGQVIAQGRDYREVFQHFRPGFDLALERQRRAEAGLAEHFNGRDLYPDVRRVLRRVEGRRATSSASRETRRPVPDASCMNCTSAPI